VEFSQKLINWYNQNKRDLPWRKTKNPYFVWLSEIMLQQTRVAQGLSYYLKFTETFPTVFDLAKADEETVLKLWQGLGYYSRARNLHFTSKYIANDLDGKFPNTYEEIKKLKGIGDYTASAVASICFNEPTAVVDGNVYRVLARYYGIDTPINSSKGIKEFKQLAQEILDKEHSGTFNQAIMDFGAIQCKPKKPLCLFCPFSESCVALQKGKVEVLPVKEKKIKVRKRYFNYLVVKTKNDKTILNLRQGKGIWQGLYEFPVVETTTSINYTELLASKDFQELFSEPTQISLFNEKEIVHKLSHQHLYTKFWIVETNQTTANSILWEEIFNYPVPVLIANFLEQFVTKK
jgi:A/G-specific adenine glycosylase